MYLYLCLLSILRIVFPENFTHLETKIPTEENTTIIKTPYYAGPAFEKYSENDIEEQSRKVDNSLVGEKMRTKILASIQIGDSFNPDNFTHRCCGALVTTSVVISVGHCVHDQYGNYVLEPSTYRIIIGINFISGDPKIHYVTKVKLHSGYLKENKLNDLSMFKLQIPQEVIILDLSQLRSENLPEPVNCTYYAWIPTHIEILEGRYLFSSFKVDMEEIFDCDYELAMNQNFLTPLHKCFLVPTTVKTTCLYNPGAPILCQDVLFGLHSYSFPSQHSQVVARVGTYLDVGKYIDAIESFARESAKRWIIFNKRVFYVIISMHILKYLFVCTFV